MIKPEIYAKSSFKIPNMKCKKRIGSNGIEIQLIEELRDNQGKNIRDFLPIEEAEWYDIRAVHCPLIDDKCLLIEDIVIDKEFRLFERVCEIANHYGSKYNRQIIVVIHSESTLDNLYKYELIWTALKQRIKLLLNEYPYIKIGIENVTPCVFDIDSPEIRFANNFGFDNVSIVKCLREELRTTRIGTVLDTCHAGITEYYTRDIFDAIDKPYYFSIKNFFDMNKDVCFLIHLSWFKDGGFKDGDHGIPFDETTIFIFQTIMEFYKSFGYSCPLTLEVREDDYLVCENYQKMKTIVDNYFNELD